MSTVSLIGVLSGAKSDGEAGSRAAGGSGASFGEALTAAGRMLDGGRRDSASAADAVSTGDDREATPAAAAEGEAAGAAMLQLATPLVPVARADQQTVVIAGAAGPIAAGDSGLDVAAETPTAASTGSGSGGSLVVTVPVPGVPVPGVPVDGEPASDVEPAAGGALVTPAVVTPETGSPVLPSDADGLILGEAASRVVQSEGGRGAGAREVTAGSAGTVSPSPANGGPASSAAASAAAAASASLVSSASGAAASTGAGASSAVAAPADPAEAAPASASTAATAPVAQSVQPTVAPAPAPAPPIPSAEASANTNRAVAVQVAPVVVSIAQRPMGTHQLTMTVDPDSLGPVTVRAHISAGGEVRVELTGVTDAGRDALRGILVDLRRDLAAVMPQATLSVGHGTGSDANADRGGQQGAGGAAGDQGTGDRDANRGRTDQRPVPERGPELRRDTQTTAHAAIGAGLDIFA